MTITLRHLRLAKNIRKYPTMKKAKMKSGYTETYAHSSHHKKTKGFKEISKTILERYEKELQSILDAMELKDKNSEEYQVLVRAADTIQKQIQLLGGKPTEIVDDYSNITTEELERRIKQLEEGKDKKGVGQKKT